ncbi:deoxyribose-phosphate aldolase [Idiomarina seosinensis]|uniref:Deoxyribose-phosphate aldolase n=1 Tax=Idiomarina seosinensis TaxID=281739 RepID=A0A432ZJE4_9GAMM|nr:deoxyribose-phosphate aldolase [Idiomarina seosinensis]RUO78086.1 deoxyribose-phosphate aldolase [Idiomarina seosinensis]
MRAKLEQIASFIDLTTLNNDDTVDSIAALCDKATVGQAKVAALCVFPELIVAAKQQLAQRQLSIPVATVTNFPEGNTNINRVVAETERAIAVGADEIDVVMPYQALLAGDEQLAKDLVVAVKNTCEGRARLKVIIESGQLSDQGLIRQASELSIAAGADFIKTSTGKVPVNATLEAAEIMLKAILESGSKCGFKAAGGIRTVDDADKYIELATRIMGNDWLVPANFRIGASSLVDDLKQQLT